MLGVSIVVYHSRWDALAATIDGLNRQTRGTDRLAVHVNSAEPTELAALEAKLTELSKTPLRFTASTANLGFCGAHNANLARLFDDGCESVVVLNPDLILDARALGLLAETAGTQGGRALYGPLLELADPSTLTASGLIDTAGTAWVRGARHLDVRQGEPMVDLPTEPYDTAAISGACIFVPAEAFHEIVRRSGEFFDEDFFAYREDAELGYRAALLGIPSRVVPLARGLHVRRLRGTSRRVDPLINSLGVRNRFLFAFKYGVRRPGGAFSALARDLLVVSGVLLAERSSIGGLQEAWRLRGSMRAKRRLLVSEGVTVRR